MKKLIMALGFSLVASMTNAQEPLYDLNEMPEGYSFVSEGSGQKITLTYLGRSGDLFTVKYQRAYVDGRNETGIALVNQASQATSYADMQGARYYSPNDCFPSVGECRYTYRSNGPTISVRVSTEDVDGVWVAEREIQQPGDDGWVFFGKACTTYDAYGFWFDSWTVDADGTSNYQLRTDPPVEGDPEERLQKLRTACGVDEVPLV